MPACAPLKRAADDPPHAPIEQPEPPEPLDPRLAREAAHWLMRLHPAAEPDDDERRACLAWRARHAQHERAWQRAQQLDRTFGIIPAELGLATLGRPQQQRRQAVKKLALLLTLAPASLLAYQQLPVAAWRAAHRTGTGERRSVRLADGSHVQMNTGTAFDVVYSQAQRLLVLHEGELLIETAPDERSPARPFRVRTAAGMLRAIGTRFSVQQHAACSSIAVFDGAVEVRAGDDDDHQRILASGHQLRFSTAALGPTEPLDAHGADWVDGILYADNQRLADFSAELARHRRGWLECDPAVAGLRISGSFQLDDPERILRALTRTLPVRIVYRTRFWTTIAPA